MNVYHITYAPQRKEVYLHFWGCNLSCKACLCLKEIYDCHLEETKMRLFYQNKENPSPPTEFLSLGEVLSLLKDLVIERAIYMGAEPTVDPQFPLLAEVIKKDFKAYNILLTNGFIIPPLSFIDEVVFSLKAFTDSLHKDYTGKSNKVALRNFPKIYKGVKRFKAESILIPGYIDREEIGRIAQFIASIDKSIPFRIDAYIPVGDNPWRRPYEEEIEEAVVESKKFLLNVSCLKGNEDLKFDVVRVF